MAHLLVIGSPSLDIIHIGGETFQTMGGAGMYVGMAARRSGVDVSVFGPRPMQIPDLMIPFHDRLVEWLGPEVRLEDMPRFEISHDGDTAEYLSKNTKIEGQIDPELLPEDLSVYDGIHITAMGDASVQKAFLDVCQARNARFISMGTWRHHVTVQKAITVELIKRADASFMNEEEARSLFGSLDMAQAQVGNTLFITLANKGALIIQGDHRTRLPAQKVNAQDPTGAGESFCGAAVANLLLGRHPVITGMRAMILAAEVIKDIGPNALMRADPLPEVQLDPRVEINTVQVQKISTIIKDLPDARSFDFVSEYLPPVGHPTALDFFFAGTLQQFSFWSEANGRYYEPMIAVIDGIRRKGSAYLYAAYNRLIDQDPLFFTPERQTKVTEDEMRAVFRADDGTDPMPAIELHVEMANAYGRDMLALGLTPAVFIAKAQASDKPLETFVKMLDHIGGYKEDPIRKKSNLLALNISQRPEAFLKLKENEAVAPVVDYHCMRAILRQGLVNVLDKALKRKLANRELLSADEEWAVRIAGYQIQELVEQQSGKPIGAVDWFFFNYTRNHCPEMSDPVCAECAVDTVCAKRKELFQPVLRTTYY